MKPDSTSSPNRLRAWIINRAVAVVLLVVAPALVAPSPGLAQGPPEVMAPIMTVGTPSGWTGISGDGGLSSETLRVTGGWVLRSIGFGERRDRPCYASGGFMQQDKKAYQAEELRRGQHVAVVVMESESREVRKCEDGEENISSRRYLSVGNSDLPRAIHAVRVCQRRSNDRIKGIEIFGSEIEVNGPRRDPALAVSEERPNCNEWNTKVSCPEGEVAVELRVEFRGESAVGMSLRCAPARIDVGG